MVPATAQSCSLLLPSQKSDKTVPRTRGDKEGYLQPAAVPVRFPRPRFADLCSNAVFLAPAPAPFDLDWCAIHVVL
ncbi:hypothetical protein GUJ93_ZPchr0009g953 [Zizania palustris]|uniref:Uncharacterized protein n=1 Tax=Zizania palustris TaxID=103762 RepID=A0A8J5VMS7_ZIZPA|nr:hypothetical protein GUJ93_ZPchr0009g953 [Zizania palustris]